MRCFGQLETEYGSNACYLIWWNSIKLFSNFGKYKVVVDFSIIHKNEECYICMKTFGNNSEAVIL
jgi:hypothetical protein